MRRKSLQTVSLQKELLVTVVSKNNINLTSKCARALNTAGVPLLIRSVRDSLVETVREAERTRKNTVQSRNYVQVH